MPVAQPPEVGESSGEGDSGDDHSAHGDVEHGDPAHDDPAHDDPAHDDPAHDDYADVASALTEMRAEPDAVRRARMRDDAINRCLPLAENIARRYADRGAAFDDLLQVACIGVVNAVDRFDAEQGADFLAFAVPTVMGEVKRHFRDTTWSIRVPRRAQELALEIARAGDELVQQLGRSPRPTELAAHLDIPVDDVIDGLMARSAYAATSIDAASDDAGRPIADRLGDDDPELARIDEFATLRTVLENLSERERRILVLRFFHAMSQSEIAKQVGVSQMHVSRILASTLRTLRSALGPREP